jgi:hypothetical protein
MPIGDLPADQQHLLTTLMTVCSGVSHVGIMYDTADTRIFSFLHA